MSFAIKWPGSGQAALEHKKETPAEGRYNCTLVNVEARVSKKGAMLNFTWKIDDPPYRDEEVKDSIWFSTDASKQDNAINRIGALSLATGFEPEFAEGQDVTPEALAAIFPLGKLKANLSCIIARQMKVWASKKTYKADQLENPAPEQTEVSSEACYIDATEEQAAKWRSKGGTVYENLEVEHAWGNDNERVFQPTNGTPSTNGTPKMADDELPF